MEGLMTQRTEEGVAVATTANRPEIKDADGSKRLEIHPIKAVLENFIREVESLVATLPITMMLVQAATQAEWKRLDSYIRKIGNNVAEDGGKVIATLPLENYQEYSNRQRRFDRFSAASKTIPRSFLTSIVSHYDAFVGALLRSMFYLRPEMLNASERQLTFAELSEFTSLDDAREYIVEKEVESVIRNSHDDQFRWMESRFKVELRKDLSSWPRFIEVMERRNLFVHCNGIVSTQYLRVCQQHKALLPEIKLGDELQAPSEYFENAHEVIVEIGVKLAYVLWRKLRPEEVEDADNAINEVALNLIRDERFLLARTLLDFACSQKKFGSESIRRVLILNQAQVHKWTGDDDGMEKILQSQDWTASNEKFQLAVAVLRGEFAGAASLMRRIGAESSPNKGDYKEWPIFRQFRDTKEFAEAYVRIFGEPHVESQAPVEKAVVPVVEVDQETIQ
jgi:hypothetical protein